MAMHSAEASAPKHHYAFGVRDDGKDFPPVGSDGAMTATTALATRSAASENAIKTHVMIALSLGLIPLPVFDFAMLTANQIKMVHTLGEIHGGHSFHDNRLKALVLSFVSGALPVLGIIGLSSGIKIMPGIGSLLGSGSVAVSGGLLTYGVGRVFVKQFESGGTYLSLDLKTARAQLNQEMEKGRSVVSDLKDRLHRAHSRAT